MFESLAAELCDRVVRAVAERGVASLMLSGGSTPRPLFETLSEEELDWSAVRVGLVDERWVPESHPDSNAGLVRSTLLQGAASAAVFVPMFGGESSAREGEAACEERLAAIPRPFDILLLGMGDDGHTASLFPGASRLHDALVAPAGRSCMAITAPGAHHERMSLTLPTILDARRIFLLVAGETKRRVLEEALAGNDPEEMPVRAVLGQDRTAVEIYWAE